METYDQFPINLLESQGSIVIPSINVISDNINVWENGTIIEHGITPTSIFIESTPSIVKYKIENENLERFICLIGSFAEKSENKDRILLSTNLFAGGLGEYKRPDMLSLFYQKGSLAKLQFTIMNPSRIVEFTIPIFKRTDVKRNNEDSYETKVNLCHLMCVIASSKVTGMRNTLQRQLIEFVIQREHIPTELVNRVNNNASSISFIVPKDTQKRLRIVYDMVLVMVAGGMMSDEEKGFIGSIAYQFGFDPERILDSLLPNAYAEIQAMR